MNTEDMKTAWRDTAHSLKSGTSPERIVNDFRNKNPRTSLDRLRERYRRFAIAGMTACPTSCIFLNSRLFPDGDNLLLTVVFATYFLIASAMDWWLYLGIGRIDPLTMSVSEVITRAIYYRKKHLQFIIVLIPLAVIILGFLAYSCGGDIYFLTGMLLGGLAGLAIGLRALREFMRDYKNIA